MTHLVTPAARLRVLRCNRVLSVCAWHGALPTVHVCFEKSFTLITCNLNPGPRLGDRNSRAKFENECLAKLGLEVIRGSCRLRRYREELKRREKSAGAIHFGAATCRIYAAERDRSRLSPIVFRNFRIMMTPLDRSDGFHSVEDDH